MISHKLVDIIKNNADELTRRLMKDVLSREETRSYRNLPEDLVYERVHDVYSRLDIWLGHEKPKEEIQNYYIELGRKRFMEGIPLAEVIMMLMLIKRHLWMYVLESQFVDSAYELHQALELNNRVVLFFDRMIYFSTIGYEEEYMRALSSAKGGFLAKLLKKN